MRNLEIRTRQREEFIEITSEVQQFVRDQGLRSGVVVVYVPHTTAGCTINENADPDVVRDMMAEMGKFVPYHSDYRHAEGNSDSHIKASMMGASQLILVEDGHLLLGRWQGIYFCEFDGPRQRQVNLKALATSSSSGENPFH